MMVVTVPVTMPVATPMPMFVLVLVLLASLLDKRLDVLRRQSHGIGRSGLGGEGGKRQRQTCDCVSNFAH